MNLPTYHNPLLNKQRVAGSWNDYYHRISGKVSDGIHSKKLQLGAAATLGLAALVATGLPKKTIDYWSSLTPSIEHASKYITRESYRPYVVRPRDTVDKLSGGNPLAKEYIMRANGIKNSKRDLKAGDIIAIPETNDEVTLRELLRQLPLEK